MLVFSYAWPVYNDDVIINGEMTWYRLFDAVPVLVERREVLNLVEETANIYQLPLQDG